MLLAVPPKSDQAPPMYWRRTFPGAPDQARTARTLAALLLTECPALDEVLLVLDELVVNALKHTKSGQQGGAFTVELRRDAGGVTIAVADQGGCTEPAALDADDLDESGRGLRAISLLASKWGWYGNDQGRTVTAEIASTWPE